jgi:DNA repair protein RecO (recombination protein O)
MPELPRVYATPAIVLRQRKLGDADKIVTLYTATAGKVDVVAKGVRRTRSRLAGHLEPLTHASFQLARGKSLDIVTQVQTIDPYPSIRDDLERLSRGLYACELLDRFTELREPHLDLYHLLLHTLQRIATRDDYDTAVRFYEMTLLEVLGYRPELEECVVCRRRLAPETNFWSPAGGGVLCAACRARDEAAHRPLSVNALKVLRVLARGHFPDAARLVVPSPLAAELERTLLEYVRWVLERDVRSAAFIDAIRRRRPPRPRHPNPGPLPARTTP